MKPVARFIGIACLVEFVGLAISLYFHISWVLDILMILFALYLVFLAVRGWKKQMNIEMPEILQAKTVRKRHWRLF